VFRACAASVSLAVIPSLKVAFTAKLWRYPGKGGWHFVTLPDKYAPLATHRWGRTPVVAVVDGHEWRTSVWRGSKKKRSVLAIPKSVRGAKRGGDSVKVRLTFDSL
jgi:hypothetical protein